MAKGTFGAGVQFTAAGVEQTIAKLAKLEVTMVRLGGAVDTLVAKFAGFAGRTASAFNTAPVNKYATQVNAATKAIDRFWQAVGRRRSMSMPAVPMPRVPGGGAPGYSPGGSGAAGGLGASSILPFAAMMRGAASGFDSMLTYSGEFSQNMAGVGAVMRATASEMNQLREAALTAGEITQFSPTDAVKGLMELATAGQTSSEAIKTLIPVLDLAAASMGQLSVPRASAAIIGTLNSYKLGADQAGMVTDKLARITQLTNFQMRDFTGGLAKAASIGGMFGQSLDDVLVTLGLLRNRNIDASSSGTAFREATRRVGAMTLAQNALTQHGIVLFDKQTGHMRPVVEIMKDLVVASQGISEAERNRVANIAFGARGMLAFTAIADAQFTTMRNGVAVTLQGADAIKALREAIADSSGAAQEFREKLLDTYAGQKQLITGTIQTWGVVLGEPFTRVMKPIVRFVNEGLLSLERAFRALPDPIKDTLAQVVLVGAAFLGAATVWGVFATYILPTLATGFAAILPALTSVAFYILPLIGAGYALREAWTNNFGGIQQSVEAYWNALKGLWAILTSWKNGTAEIPVELAEALNRAGIKDWVIKVGGWLGRMKQYAFDAIGVFTKWGKAASLEIMPPLRALWQLGQTVAGVVGDIFDKLTGFSNEPIEGVRKSTVGFSDALAWVSTRIQQGAKAVQGWILHVKGWVEANREQIVNTVVEVIYWVEDFVSIVWDRIGLAFSKIYDNVTVIWDRIGEVIRKVYPDIEKTAGKIDWLKVTVNAVMAPLEGLAMVLEGVAWVMTLLTDNKEQAKFWDNLKSSLLEGGSYLANLWLPGMGGLYDIIVKLVTFVRENWKYVSFASSLIPGFGGAVALGEGLSKNWKGTAGAMDVTGIGGMMSSPSMTSQFIIPGVDMSRWREMGGMMPGLGGVVAATQSNYSKPEGMSVGRMAGVAAAPMGIFNPQVAYNAVMMDRAAESAERQASSSDQVATALKTMNETMQRVNDAISQLTPVMMSLPEGISMATSGGQSSSGGSRYPMER